MSGTISKYLNWLKRLCCASNAPKEAPAAASANGADGGKQSAEKPAVATGSVPAEVKAATAPKSEPAVPAPAAKVEVPKAEAAVEKAPKADKPAEKTAPERVDATAEFLEERVVKDAAGWVVPEGVRENENDVLFQDFNLDARILRAVLEDLGFTKCSPIQGLALPQSLAGKDIAGQAQTGTGKTAAFLITVLQKFLKRQEEGMKRAANQPFALVLAPTRELAIQIAHDANSLCAYCHFKTVPVYGGMDYDKQRRMLTSNVDMVVATPGRLIDYLQQHVVDLEKVEMLVIDEADRMLDMGFIPDVKRIIFRLRGPETRQTLLFSATLNHDIMNLASRWMRPDPVCLEVAADHKVAEGVQETIYAVRAEEKFAIMLWILNHDDCHRVLIFRNRRRDVEELHDRLKQYGVESEMLSGDVDQKKRLNILENFKIGKVKIIVATDVAGRGIHVDDVTHVFNYDFPYEAEDYVHRVGRTARAGHTGRAISFADEENSFVIPEIEKYIGRALPISNPEPEMLQLPPKVARSDARPAGSGDSRAQHGGPSHGGHRGGRPFRRNGGRR